MSSRPAFLGLLLLATVLGAVIVLELGDDNAGDDATGIVAIRHPPLPQARLATEDPVDHTDEWVAAILARPLFSRDRRPTPVLASSSGPATMSALPRLTGVLVGPFGRSAIFAGADGGKPVVVSEGKSIGPYKVTAISPGRVTVTGPEGDQQIAPSYDASVRHVMTADTQQQQQQLQQQQVQQQLQLQQQQLPRPLGINIRPQQFQRALSAIENPGQQQQQQSTDK